MIRGSKGQVAWVLIFVVAVFAVGISTYSFLDYETELQESSFEYSRLILSLDSSELYVKEVSYLIFYESLNCSDCSSKDMKEKMVEVSKRYDSGNDADGNYFAKMRNGEFEIIELGDENYKFIVRGVFVRGNYGDNVAKKNFDLDLTFK